MDLPSDLAAALDAATADIPLRELEASVDRLIARYRAPGRADRPILGGGIDAAAYAAYRMPATWGAVRAALAAAAAAAGAGADAGRVGDADSAVAVADLGTEADAAGAGLRVAAGGRNVRPVPEPAALPKVRGLAPRTLVDVGGGTGAAAWAAAEVFGSSLKEITVLDQVPEALELGRRLARDAFSGALRHAEWRQVRFPADVPAADLVTVSYVLSELAADTQRELVRASAAGAGTIAVIEPGTPDGYQRIMAAREVLVGMGLRVVAPCPHSDACPLLGTRDWCHFASRIHRSPLHRRLKSADLQHEDEKFAYVVATRTPVEPLRKSRILRHPQIRKGLVMMQLCQPDGTTAQTLVSKRQGDTYRAARDADWGDSW